MIPNSLRLKKLLDFMRFLFTGIVADYSHKSVLSLQISNVSVPPLYNIDHLILGLHSIDPSIIDSISSTFVNKYHSMVISFNGSN